MWEYVNNVDMKMNHVQKGYDKEVKIVNINKLIKTIVFCIVLMWATLGHSQDEMYIRINEDTYLITVADMQRMLEEEGTVERAIAAVVYAQYWGKFVDPDLFRENLKIFMPTWWSKKVGLIKQRRGRHVPELKRSE